MNDQAGPLLGVCPAPSCFSKITTSVLGGQGWGVIWAPFAHQFLGTHPAGTIRFSVGYFTSEEDFEELRQALNYIEENL